MIVLVPVVLVVAVFLTFVATSTLWWMLHAWRSAERYDGIGMNEAADPVFSFSLIVPCRHESERVMSATIDRLLAQRHPDFEIIISLGDDDPDTIAAAGAIAARDGRVRCSVNTDPVKNKPRQLNSALLECTKDLVGVIDAESLTAPRLLGIVDAAFSVRRADVVQSAVHLVNLRSRWFSLRNCLEYRIWFRSRLHGHAENGFVPLGGNTVFVRRTLLEEVGGWDGDCLAEDCEIGVRLSAMGCRTVCLYDPAVVTEEETPDSVRAFVKQRTRWSLGFMQVLAKGEWRTLPTTRQRWAAAWLLAQQYTVAVSGLVLPLSVAAAVIGSLPVLVVLVAFLPLVPTALTLGFELLVLHEFGRELDLAVRGRDYVWLVLSTPLYQALLAVAAVRALVKLLSGDLRWEKTGHAGAHLDDAAVSA